MHILTISVFLYQVTGIVLRGIFLVRKKEIDWFYEGGAAAIYPDGIYIYVYIFLIILCWSTRFIAIVWYKQYKFPVRSFLESICEL